MIAHKLSTTSGISSDSGHVSLGLLNSGLNNFEYLGRLSRFGLHTVSFQLSVHQCTSIKLQHAVATDWNLLLLQWCAVHCPC